MDPQVLAQLMAYLQMQQQLNPQNPITQPIQGLNPQPPSGFNRPMPRPPGTDYGGSWMPPSPWSSMQPGLMQPGLGGGAPNASFRPVSRPLPGVPSAVGAANNGLSAAQSIARPGQIMAGSGGSITPQQPDRWNTPRAQAIRSRLGRGGRQMSSGSPGGTSRSY